jgi:hypothetical protein
MEYWKRAAAIAAIGLAGAATGTAIKYSPLTAARPDHHLTPGLALSDVTLEQIKEPNYSRGVRDVGDAERHAVARRYGKKLDYLHKCEIDHLIPLSWGGSNDLTNLWPQPYDDTWGARVKDRLEVHGLKLIREGKLPLPEAQDEIARDWIGMYKRLIGPTPVHHQSMPHEQ